MSITLENLIESVFKDKYIKLLGRWEEKYPEFMQIYDASLDTKAEYYGNRTITLSITVKKENLKLSQKYFREAEQIVALGMNYIYIEIDIDDAFELKDSLEEKE